MKKIKTTVITRAPKLLSSIIKFTQKKDIDTIVNNLSELKGMPQKIGQMISMDFSEYLPPDFREKFSKLQSESKQIDGDQILSIIKEELGVEKFSLITHFEKTPIGAGSIGQVHRATIKEKNVVFKVRYPDIEKTIESDLSLMLPLAKAYELFRPKSKDLSILIGEAKAMLVQEMNYHVEVQHLDFFKNSLAQHEKYYIPDVLKEYCTEQLICMEYIEGSVLKDFILEEKKVNAQKFVAEALLELFIIEFFELGAVQTDPNFSNWIIREDFSKGAQIILLDFGATKNFNKEFRKIYFELLKAAYENNKHDIIYFGEKLGLVDRKDNQEAIDLFLEFMIEVMSYFRPEHNPVNFANEEITKKLMQLGWELWKKQRISSPNANLVFLHRKLGGLFALLKELKIELDLHHFWKELEAKLD